MNKKITPIALLVAMCAVSADVVAQHNPFRQTFKAGSFNTPSDGGVYNFPLTVAPPPATPAGTVIGREQASGSVDVLAVGQPGYQAGVGSDSQLRLASGPLGGLNRFFIYDFADPMGGIMPGQFYGAFSIKTNPQVGHSIGFSAGERGVNAIGQGLANTATNLTILNHPTNGLRIAVGSTNINLNGINDFWNAGGTNRIEVYVNNTGAVAPYFRCSSAGPIVLNPLTQHVYLNGNLLTRTTAPATVNLPVGTMPVGMPINDITMTANGVNATTGAGADSWIDDINYASNLLPPALAGPYTVNPDGFLGNNFPDLETFQDAINCKGTSSAIAVNFTPGTYQGPLVLGQYTNPITLTGNDATIEFCPVSAGANVSAITLNGTDNVTIDGFNLNAICTYGTGVRLLNGTDNVIISNNDINVLVPGPNSTSIANKGIYATNPGNLTIIGNSIAGGRRGIQVEDATGLVTIGTANSGPGATNLLGNVVFNAYEYGISVIGANSPSVSHNTVSMRGDYTSSVGINGNLINGFTFDSNLILNAGRAGIQLNNSNTGAGASQSVVVNNRIGAFQPSAKAYGIYMYGVSDVNFYHNSLMVAEAALNYGVRAAGGNGLDVRNNIFMTGTGYPLYTAQNALDVLSHNDYWNTSGGNIAHLGAPVVNLAGLAALGYNTTGSFNVNPGFTSGTTFLGAMRTTNINLANVASAAQLVSVDFEDQPRPAGSVDLGADEFSGTARLMAASSSSLDAEVYPNPFSSALSVKLNSTEAGNAVVTLTDLMGRVISTQSYGVEVGAGSMKVNVAAELPQGVYLLQVTQGEATSTFRVVKQ